MNGYSWIIFDPTFWWKFNLSLIARPDLWFPKPTVPTTKMSTRWKHTRSTAPTKTKPPRRTTPHPTTPRPTTIRTTTSTPTVQHTTPFTTKQPFWDLIIMTKATTKRPPTTLKPIVEIWTPVHHPAQPVPKPWTSFLPWNKPGAVEIKEETFPSIKTTVSMT